MTHNDKMEHFFAHLIPPNFGTVFYMANGRGRQYVLWIRTPKNEKQCQKCYVPFCPT